jgi:ribosome-binding protein aMBF1 (putative translation factor)
MDHLQSVITARAETLGLSAYEIAKRCGESPNKEAVRRYLTGRCSLGSAYVSKICDVLGLELRAKKGRTPEASKEDR